MSTRKEIAPSSEVIETATSEILRPTIENIATETNRYLKLEVTIFCNENQVINAPHIEAGCIDSNLLNGKLRLRFRDAFGNRTIMFAEAIFERSQAVSNCSGFSLKADLREGSAKRTAFTMRYSVWNWTGWI